MSAFVSEMVLLRNNIVLAVFNDSIFISIDSFILINRSSLINKYGYGSCLFYYDMELIKKRYEIKNLIGLCKIINIDYE